jgi:hypothetical protein
MRGDSPAVPSSEVRIDWTDRWVSALLAGGAGSVLAIARWLDPSPVGHGTHTQLGLTDCTFYVLSGVPCPMCGATTTFALMTDLHILDGVLNQPFAAVLWLLTVVGFAIALAEALVPTGRWRRLASWIAPVEQRLAVLFLVFMITAWAYKIMIS